MTIGDAKADLQRLLDEHDETRGTRVEIYRLSDGVRWYWLDGGNEITRGVVRRLVYQAHYDATKYIKSYLEVVNAK